MAYRLAACAEMLFLDLPVLERVRRISGRGFLVEIWGWADKDLSALAASRARGRYATRRSVRRLSLIHI